MKYLCAEVQREMLHIDSFRDLGTTLQQRELALTVRDKLQQRKKNPSIVRVQKGLKMSGVWVILLLLLRVLQCNLIDTSS